jgi:hypothetical protein
VKRSIALRFSLALLVVASMLFTAGAAFAAGPRVRVVHASPDAPAVDIWVDGTAAFTNAPFKGITQYAGLTAGEREVKVVPAGATEPAVISANLNLDNDKDYTVVAVGRLADISPLVLEDNNAAPAAGKAHVRFVHASPDAPAVDIAVKGGPVLFSNIAFKGVGEYLPVNAGTYDLEVRLAGTSDVALALPGVTLENSAVYTVYAMGLAGGEPKLTAVTSVDRAAGPATLPVTGGESWLALMAVAGLGLLLVGGAMRFARISVRNS